MKNDSLRRPDPDSVVSPESGCGQSRKRYASPKLDAYGTLVKLTRDSNLPPPGDIFLPGSAGGT